MKRQVTGPVYTQEIRTRLIEAFRMGATREHAAAFAGLTVRELDEWLSAGELGEEPYDMLFREVSRAIAEDAIRNQTVVSRAAAGQPTQGNWRAAAWNLERKFPRLYGRAAGAPDDKPLSPYLDKASV